MVAIGRHRLSKSTKPSATATWRCCALKPNFFSLAQQITRYRLQSTQTSDRLVGLCLRSIQIHTHDAPFEIVATMRDVPDKAGHEMTVGARHRFSALDCFWWALVFVSDLPKLINYKEKRG
jgi:hypothetical protein